MGKFKVVLMLRNNSPASSQRLSALIFLIVISLSCSRLIGAKVWASGFQNSDSSAGPTLVVQLGLQHPVGWLAISRDGRFVLTTNYGGTVLWEAATGRELRQLAPAPSGISITAEFSPDGAHVLESWSGRKGFPDLSYVTELRLSDVTDGRVIWQQEKVIDLTTDRAAEFADSFVSFSQDGRSFVMLKGKLICLRDAATGKERRCIESAVTANSMAVSPDGKMILVGEKQETLTTLSSPERREQSVLALLLDLDTGKKLAEFKHAGDVEAVAFSPDGKLLLTGSEDKTACLWEVATGKLVKKFEYQDGVTAVRFSPDNKMILTATRGYRLSRDPENRMFVWDAARLTSIKSFEVTPGYLTRAIFSPDSQSILSGTFDVIPAELGATVYKSSFFKASTRDTGWTRNVTLWNARTGEEIRRFRGYASNVTALTLSPDGRYLLTGDDGGQAHLWDVTTGRQIQRFTGHEMGITSLAVSPDSRLVLTGGWDKAARLWDAATGEIVHSFEHANFITSVAFSLDGRQAATASWDKTACLWDVASGAKLNCFEHPHGVDAVAISPDGKTVLTAFTNSEFYYPGSGVLISLWDAGSRQKLWSESVGHPIQSIQFSTDGHFALTSGDSITRYDSTLWDLSNHKSLATYLNKSVFFTQSDRLVIAYGDQGPHIDLLGFINNSFSRIEHRLFAVSSDARFGVAIGPGNAASIYKIGGGNELCRLISFNDGTWVAVNSEGRFDTNNLEEIKGLQWVMPDEPMRTLPVEIFMRDYYEPNLLHNSIENFPFKNLRRLDALNRTQPLVRILDIATQKERPDTVTVSVEVSRARSEYQHDARGNPLETGVYDLRLFREGKLVGETPGMDDDISGGREAVSGDDVELQTWRKSSQIQLDQSGHRVIKFPGIRIPRDTDAQSLEFSAYAFNEDRIKSETARFKIALAPDLPRRKGRVYVIAVGVNTYDSPDWNLSYAKNDAKLFQDVMAENLLRAKEDVFPLLLTSDGRNRAATKANIREALSLLSGKMEKPFLLKNIPGGGNLQKASPEDLVLIFFSGHGAMRNGRFYFLTSDIGTGKTRDDVTPELLRRGISSDELALWLKDIDAAEIDLIMDACESASTVTPTARAFKPGPLGNRGLGQLAYDKGMRILAASQSLSPALESDKFARSFLTQALIREGIEERKADKRPRDQRITISEMLNYAVERVPALSREGGIDEQQPALFDFIGKKEDRTLLRLPAK
jgi:WD40 repeat protein